MLMVASCGSGTAMAATFRGINVVEGTVGDVVSVAVGMMRSDTRSGSSQGGRDETFETRLSESHTLLSW